jgi:hypothetical protein
MGGAIGVLGALIAFAAFALAAPPAASPPTAQPQKLAARPPAPRPIGTYEKMMYDSQLSVNDRCAVRHGQLNPAIRPMYVNRQPVGFC